MAVMATQQPDGVLLEERPLKAAVLEKDPRNGSIEINGHTSPGDTQPGATTNGTANHEDELKTNHNKDAFSTNQALDGDLKADKMNQESGSGASPDPILGDVVTPAEDSVPADTIMTDAPAPTKELTPPRNDMDAPTPLVDAAEAPLSLVAPQSSSHEAVLSPASSAISPGTKEDVVMGDALPQPEPTPPAERVESTQYTAIGDAPITPVDDAASQAVLPSVVATDTQTSPIAPITADTSMSEPSQGTKVSRERDIDSEDEPVAKRAKVDTPAEEVQVKTAPVQDRMDVDQAEQVPTSLYRESGEPKMLSDPSLHANPITGYMNKQLRAVLAGVKKTKAGSNFRLPVSQLWPGLWLDYSAKVPNPTDISTMERHLRGDLAKYSTLGDFLSDVDLLVDNSILFNGPVHDVTQHAKATRDAILSRMKSYNAAEPVKPEKKDTVKQHPTRHTEPRATAHPPPAAAPRRPSKGAAASPVQKPVVDSPAFAIPASNNGVPLIRRDSTKVDGRAKRPVKPPHSKDLVYDTKRKKKLPLDVRFCEEVLNEIRKQKYFELNGAFMQPVDPVALNIPSYHKIVKKPMDLTTMLSKMSAGEYGSAKEFERDFELIVKNCRLFNGEDHVIYDQALRLQSLFNKEFAKKDEWMARHQPAAAPSQTATSPAPKDDSDDEDHESEAEPEVDEEYKAAQQRVATIQKRLEEEQKKVNDMVNSGSADITDVEIAQSVVAMLQRNLMEQRAKFSAMTAKKPKPKPTKAKKPLPSGGRKSGVGAGGSGAGSGLAKRAGGNKKAASARRKLTVVEKEVVAGGIAELEGSDLEKAIDIIKRDTGQGENDSGELELDIEQLSNDALVRLYDLVIKVFPNLKAEKEKAQPPPVDAPPARSKGSSSKAKKNKPMSKQEQERRIQQLNELRAQVGRQASGSQEPMESIEGNGRGSNDPAPNPAQETDDEESSEEE